MELRRISLAVSGTALAYFGLSRLNHHLFSSFSFSVDVNWVFLPSGVCLFAVLLFEQWGALGVVLGSLGFLLFQQSASTDTASTAVSLCLVGLAPLLARQICVAANGIKSDLTGLTPADLFRVMLVFSAVGAAVHQSWFAMRAHSQDVLTGFIAMFTGNVVGAVIVIYAAKVVLALYPRLRGG